MSQEKLSFLRDLLGDEEGRFSVMRLCTVITPLLVLIPWAVSIIKSGVWIPLDWPEVGLISTAFGGKALQSGFEYGSLSGDSNAGGNKSIEK